MNGSYQERRRRKMRRSKKALVATVIYTVCVTGAIIANQRNSDMEGVIVGQVLLGLPWDVVPLLLGINAWYGPYVYALAITLNATTLYAIVAWLTKLNSK